MTPVMFLSSVQSVSATDTSNVSKTFYDWAAAQSGGTRHAYYVRSQDRIKWVTRGATMSGSGTTYRTIGFQVRATLNNGTTLWTIMPLGQKNFTRIHEASYSDGNTYSLLASHTRVLAGSLLR